MNSRERINQILQHEEVDRIPFQEGSWQSTVERWRKEGLPKDVEIDEFFGYEMKFVNPNITAQFNYEILEENEEYIIERNEFGEIVKNHKNRSTTPQILDSPIKDINDWAKLKKRFDFNKKRGISYISNINFKDEISISGGLDEFKKSYNKGKFMVFCVAWGFDLLQRYVGMERLLMSIVTDPEWVVDMAKTNAKLVLDMYEYLNSKGYYFDAVLLCSDLGYKNATMFSPQHYKELFYDIDKDICSYFHHKNLKVLLHSCGNVNMLVPFFVEIGIDCLNPLEVKAGMNIIELKAKYGNKLSFWGGIDTRLYSSSDLTALENEIKNKIEIAKKGGGYIYSCDHSVPHDVSFDNYKKIMNFVKKYGTYI